MTQSREPRPILAPIDFSAHSENSLASALNLAARLGHPVLILHVIHDPGNMPGYYALKKKQMLRIEDSAKALMDEFLADFAKRHPEFSDLETPEPILVRGLPANRIIEVAERKDASMIIMGSRGVTGLKHLLLGSVAEKVVRLSPIPVTVVKKQQIPAL